MNSCHGLAHWFFIIIVLSIVQFAVSQYEALYFIESMNDYLFLYNMTYDSANKHYVAKAPNYDIMIACPSRDGNPDHFEVRKIKRNEAAVLRSCEKPIESRTYQSQKDGKDIEDMKSIGFWIRDTSRDLLDETSEEITDDSGQKGSIEDLEQPPEKTPRLHSVHKRGLEKTSHDNSYGQDQGEIQVEPATKKLLELIVFKFEETERRIKFAWHTIAPGKLLNPQISRKNNKPYRTNPDFYPYNVDSLYAQSSGTYVKVQLTPEEDFLFEYGKSASRQNILTAPMRRDLLPQWQQLEIFIRKVTQIIDEIAAMTGIHGTLTQFDQESQHQPIYLHDGQYEIPALFWKAVSVDFFHDNTQYRNGIVFVLHNVDPQANQIVPKICPNDDLSKTGWKFPTDVKFKHLMYACLWNSETMRAFGEDEYNDNKVFNLNSVPTLRTDEKGNKIFERVNVIEKMNSGILNTFVSYFINVVSYPITFFSSYYYEYNKNK